MRVFVCTSPAISQKPEKRYISNMTRWLPQIRECITSYLFWPWPPFKVTQIWIMKIINVRLNFSSNAHQVCCEDSPTKELYNLFLVRWPWRSFKVTTASQTWHIFNYDSNISDDILLIQTCHKGGLMHGVHARFDDLDLDARAQWVSRGQNQRWITSTTKQKISIKLTTTVGHF